MIYFNGTKQFNLKHTAVAIGKFDGLHRGHQVLLNKLRTYRDKGYMTVMFTFDFHPMSVLTGQLKPLIYATEERKKIVAEMGIDVMIEYPFNQETAHMMPEEFVRDVLVKEIGTEVIIVGDDFHFGYQRSGDVAYLKANEERFGYKVDNCEKLCMDSEEISATIIREEISAGNIECVNNMLGRPYLVTGSVIKGKANGRKVSMPTANLVVPPMKLIPPDGVYATRTEVGGKYYYSLTNIGTNPTVGAHNDRSIESFLLDFDGDLYDKEINVYFYKYIRGEHKFADLSELRAQVARDQQTAIAYFKESGI